MFFTCSDTISFMNQNHKKILDYYRSLESKLGYNYLTWEIKHLGYYPRNKKNISEKKAQEFMNEQIFKNLQWNKKDIVLDTGCGYGAVACYLAKKHDGKIIGLDINAYEIEKAKERSIKEKVSKNVDFRTMDYSQTNFSDKYFDAIYAIETLSHSPDIHKTLKEFYRILKPGNKIALFEYTIAKDKMFTPEDKKMLEFIIKGTAMMGLKQFRNDKFPNALKKAGFVNIKERNISKECMPSVKRFEQLAQRPYRLISLFHLQKYFVNTTWANEWYRLMKKDLWRYCIFTAKKPN